MRGDRRARIQRVGADREPRGLVLVLHGGRSAGHGNPHALRAAYLRMVPFARMLAAGRPAPGVWLGRYRYQGWNGCDRDPVRDARWALDELAGRHPGRPVVLVGHSMGARAALYVAGHRAVHAVCALAPWIEDGDPVEQLAGRTLLIAHGDQDRVTDPEASFGYAVRARAVTGRVCRFDIRGEGHAMLRRRRDWNRLVRRFVRGELGIEPEDPGITNALRQPVPSGLRVALPGAAE